MELPKRQALNYCNDLAGMQGSGKSPGGLEGQKLTLKASEKKKKELPSPWQIVLYFDTASGREGREERAVETDESAVPLMESEGLQRREHGFPSEE